MAKSDNISLIGMPGAGKSVVGSALSERLGWDFIDTDRQLEQRAGMPLQKLLESVGYLELRRLEESHLLTLQPSKTVIATGGSVVYSEPGMAHLRQISTVIFLDIDLETACQRIERNPLRGIASSAEQTLESIFNERLPLYRKFAEITIANAGISPGQAVAEIMARQCVERRVGTP